MHEILIKSDDIRTVQKIMALMENERRLAEEETEIKKGDVVKTSLSNNTIVLEVYETDVILFTGTQYVYAINFNMNKEKNKLEWRCAYYSEFLDEVVGLKDEYYVEARRK